jgi:hypothetical protein
LAVRLVLGELTNQQFLTEMLYFKHLNVYFLQYPSSTFIHSQNLMFIFFNSHSFATFFKNIHSLDGRRYPTPFTLLVPLWLSRRLIWSSWSFRSTNVASTRTLDKFGFPPLKQTQLTSCLDLPDNCPFEYIYQMSEVIFLRHAYQWENECF